MANCLPLIITEVPSINNEEYHDPELFDAAAQRMDSLPALQNTLFRAGLNPGGSIVAASAQASKYWTIHWVWCSSTVVTVCKLR